MKREAGYYWVLYPWGKWVVAYYDARLDRWEHCGCDVYDRDDQFAEIGERLSAPSSIPETGT